MFRGSDAEIGGCVHPNRHGHGQKSVLSSGASENNGAGFLRASAKTRGRFRASVLSSLDTPVSTTIASHVIKYCVFLYMNFIEFFKYVYYFSLLQMLKERISNRDSPSHVGGLLGQLFNGSFPLVSLPRYNVRLRGRRDCPGSANGRNVVAF